MTTSHRRAARRRYRGDRPRGVRRRHARLRRRRPRPAGQPQRSRRCSCCRSTTTTATSRPPTRTSSRPRPERRPRSAAPSTSRPSWASCGAAAGDAHSLTVAAGDLIGGSTFLSGHLPRRAVGGVAQRDGPGRQQRRQPRVRRGHRPSCCACSTAAATRSTAATSPTQPYAGADFQWLAANVVSRRTAAGTARSCPAPRSRQIDGVKVGFIGMTLEAHPDPGQPGRRRRPSTSRTRSRPPTPRPSVLKKQGVKAIVVLLHEGGYNAGTYNQCVGISDPIAHHGDADSAPRSTRSSPATRTTLHLLHPRPRGQPPPGHQLGVVRPDGHRDHARHQHRAAARSTAADHRDQPPRRPSRSPTTPPQSRDHRQVERPGGPAQGPRSSAPTPSRLLGDSSGNRGIETPMGDLVADAILYNTKAIGAPRSA